MMEIQLRTGLFEMKKYYLDLDADYLYMRNALDQRIIPINQLDCIKVHQSLDQNTLVYFITKSSVIEGGFITQEYENFIDQLKTLKTAIKIISDN